MSGDLPTCQQTKGERQRVPQSSDSRTLKPQPATPKPLRRSWFLGAI